MAEPKDPDLAGQSFEVETDHGAMIDITVMPNGDHYVLDVIDRETGQDVTDVLTSQTLPEIRNSTDLNLCLQVLFQDETEDNLPQVSSSTKIADWENGLEPHELPLESLTGYVKDVNAVVDDLQKTTLHTAVDSSGNDVYFRYGDIVVRTSFRYSPREDI